MLLYCRWVHLAATSPMKEQEAALEIFLPVGRCLLTLLSRRSRVVSLIGWCCNHDATAPQLQSRVPGHSPHFSFCPNRSQSLLAHLVDPVGVELQCCLRNILVLGSWTENQTTCVLPQDVNFHIGTELMDFVWCSQVKKAAVDHWLE